MNKPTDATTHIKTMPMIRRPFDYENAHGAPADAHDDDEAVWPKLLRRKCPQCKCGNAHAAGVNAHGADALKPMLRMTDP